MNRPIRFVARLVALLALTVVLFVVPVVVYRIVGQPFPTADQLSRAWRSRHVDTDTVVAFGSMIFAVLWVWFACTVVSEVVWIVRSRGGDRTVAAHPAVGPSGGVRRWVRFVLVAGLSATTSAAVLAPATAFSSDVPTSTSVAATPSAPVSAPPVAHDVHIANGRETPFSIASARGALEQREAIIDANRGRHAPDGTVWLGGVFPAGMEVVVPTPLGPAHRVEPGDSYWKIADQHLEDELGREPSPGEVLEYVHELMDLNVPILGHGDPALIHPGELVIYTDVDVAVSDPAPEVIPEPVPEVPEVAVPEVTVPEVTVPEVAVPEVTVPEVAVPEVTVPEVAVPEVAVPEVTVPATTPEPSRVPVIVADSSDSTSTSRSTRLAVGGAVMLAAGTVASIEARRRRRFRAAAVGARLATPPAHVVELERVLRVISQAERMARLDIALRAAARQLLGTEGRVQAAVVSGDGDVRLFVEGGVAPQSTLWGVSIDRAGCVLPASVALDELAAEADGVAQPCPALLHLGTSADGDVFVDIEAVGLLCVDAAPLVAADIVRAAAATLAVSPLAESAHIVTSGLEAEAHLGNPHAAAAESLDEALDLAAEAIGSTAMVARGGLTTFQLRAAATGGEHWEPVVVFAAGVKEASEALLDDVIELTDGGGRGLAVMLDRSVDRAAASIVAVDGGFVLRPWGIDLQPFGFTEVDVAALDELVVGAEQPLLEPDPATTSDDGTAVLPLPFAEPDWSVLVRLFGEPEVVSCDGEPARFERSKALELVVWLSQHRQRSTRGAARTALWDLDVRDATFANVVSDARRALARVVPPAAGEEWIGRTLTEQLPLHPAVVSDADLLTARVQGARGADPREVAAVLRPGLELVAGMPFAGTSYLWPDAEGITSSLTLLATGAATQLAQAYLALDDIEGVFWATGQGLKVLAGHEELIALRMRAHAHAGDLSGVRNEWDSYERAIAADSWAAAEPSPKLVHLRRELLAPASVS